MRWEYVIAVGIRGGLGFILGLLFGILGLFLTLWTVPGNYAPPMWLLVLTTGFAVGIAGFLAWLKPDAAWNVIGRGLLVAMAGGIAGGWIGYWYSEAVYPDGVRNVLFVAYGNLTSPPVFAFIAGAAIASTAVGSIYYSFRMWRYHEV